MPNITHTADINCTQRTLYEYIASPWLWHEWHPNSQGATASAQPLEIGDTFVEQFVLRPLPLLPLTIRRKFHYRVVDAKPHSYWEIAATGKGVKLRFRYDFEALPDGVRFTRKLDYEISGPMRLLAPLVHHGNRRNSELAMAGLAARFA